MLLEDAQWRHARGGRYRSDAAERARRRRERRCGPNACALTAGTRQDRVALALRQQLFTRGRDAVAPDRGGDRRRARARRNPRARATGGVLGSLSRARLQRRRRRARGSRRARDRPRCELPADRAGSAKRRTASAAARRMRASCARWRARRFAAATPISDSANADRRSSCSCRRRAPSMRATRRPRPACCRRTRPGARRRCESRAASERFESPDAVHAGVATAEAALAIGRRVYGRGPSRDLRRARRLSPDLRRRRRRTDARLRCGRLSAVAAVRRKARKPSSSARSSSTSRSGKTSSRPPQP